MTSLLPTPEPPDPVEGALGHFDHSNWVKAALKALDAGTVHSAGGTVSGVLNAEALTVNDPASEDAFISLVGNRNLGIQGKSAAGAMRWRLDLGDGTTEGGGNSGTLFQLLAYSDAGAQLHQVLKAARSDGLLEVKANPTAALGVATKKYVDDSIPIGLIAPYGGSVAPAGWHLCNGTAHGSAALQAIIGSANTPNLTGLFIIGAGTGVNPGTTGGVASHTLTPAQTATKGHGHAVSANAETQEHVHGIDPPNTATSGHTADHAHYTSLGGGGHGHNSSYGNNYQLSAQDQNLAGDTAAPIANTPDRFGSLFTAGDHSHAGWSGGVNQDHAHYVDIGAFNSGGRSATHNHVIQLTATVDANATAPIDNRPPYYALVYIIKKA